MIIKHMLSVGQGNKLRANEMAFEIHMTKGRGKSRITDNNAYSNKELDNLYSSQ